MRVIVLMLMRVALLHHIMLMETCEALQEKHGQKSKRRRQHDWIDGAMIHLVTGGILLLGNFHDGMWQHVKERHAKHDARDK